MKTYKLKPRFLTPFAFILTFASSQLFAAVSGERLWVEKYNSLTNKDDGGISIATGKDNALFVTGSSANDYGTLKYDSSGNRKWFQNYNGPAGQRDSASAVALDSNNNVFVTGLSEPASSTDESDIATVKYNQNGVRQWVRRFDGKPADGYGFDDVKAIGTDINGNVFVAGQSKFNRQDGIVIKYDKNGNRKWVKLYGDTGFGGDFLALTVCKSGNICVTGSSGIDQIVTVMYNNITGNPKWTKKYAYPSNHDLNINIATNITKDSNDNIYVTGFHDTLGTMDLIIIKYDKNGNRKWVKTLNAGADKMIQPNDIAVDKNGNVYVVGYKSDQDYYDYKAFIMKLDSSGNIKWNKSYGKVASQDDSFRGLAIGLNGKIYVTGYSYRNSTNKEDVITAKYDVAGNRIWLKNYNGPGNGDDAGMDIAIDGAGNVCVVGYCYSGSKPQDDYVLLKYAP